MSQNTQYNVVMAGETVDSRSSKQAAIRLAEATALENPAETIEVTTSNGTVVHTVEPTQGKRGFRPWTRTETHEGMEVEVPEGFVVAYTRKRVGAVVARSEAKDGWLVLTVAGDQFEASNTKEAREITNDLAAKHREAAEQAKEAAKVAKAEAKAKREADRAAAKEAKEAEKEAKRLAKEAAAAEAEAAEAEDSELVEA